MPSDNSPRLRKTSLKTWKILKTVVQRETLFQTIPEEAAEERDPLVIATRPPVLRRPRQASFLDQARVGRNLLDHFPGDSSLPPAVVLPSQSSDASPLRRG